jgi:predicted deacylase
MKHLGMLAGQAAYPARQRVIDRKHLLYSTVGGMALFTTQAGASVSKGQEIGRLVASDGAIKSVLQTPADGIATVCRSMPVVLPGDLILIMREISEVIQNT